MKKFLIFALTFLHLTASHAQDAPANRYAGIEIGSTGVKFTVIDLKSKIDSTKIPHFIYDKIEEDSDNTKFIEFTEGATKQTAEAVEKFYKKASVKYRIPDLSIYICVSHGVVSQSMKKDGVTSRTECGTLTALKKRILEKIPVYGRKRNGCIGLLDEHEEPELTHMGVIPYAIKDDVALVDIGSGNTKGGYFLSNPKERFVPFEIVEGTRSLSNRAKKDLPPADFDRLYLKRVQDIVNVQMASEIQSSASDIRTKLHIILTGGICWATARITDLEDNEDMQQITIADVNRVINIVSDNESFKSLQAKAKLPENKELKRVLDVFNQDLLISGSVLLEKMLKEIKRSSPDYHFYVYKASYVGWLKGYIIASISTTDTGYKAVCREGSN
jgi:hypothetical protein